MPHRLSLLFSLLAFLLAAAPACAQVHLRAPWSHGEWWQPSSYPPTHDRAGATKAVDFSRVSQASLDSYGGVWPYADDDTPGVEVRAAHDGQVVYGARWDGAAAGYGHFLLVVSTADSSRSTLYAHLERFAVPNRKIVRAGEVIGYCGETGAGGRPRLHFEYRVSGVRQDTSQLVFDGQPVAIDYRRLDNRVPGGRYVGVPIQARAAPEVLVRAFPGAVGFGAFSVGGRGGRVIEVTNLNATGAGSLRAALLATGPRTVLFRVSGTVDLRGQTIFVRSPYLTVAGQTAPGGGLTIKGGNLDIATHNVILRHLRVRPGPGGWGGPDGAEGGDCIKINSRNAYNIILDHVSLSWSTDEILSAVQEAHNVTVQHCLLAEPMDYVPEPNTHPQGAHSKSLFQAYSASRVTYWRNLLTHSLDRVPTVTSGDAQYVNNVAYNANKAAIMVPYNRSTPIFAQFEGNGFIQGPNTVVREELRFIHYTQPSSNGVIEGNVMPMGRYLIPAGANKVWLLNGTVSDIRPRYVVDGRWVSLAESNVTYVPALRGFPPLTALSPAAALDAVLAEAGATRPHRDAVDQRVLADVRNRTGQVINHPGETVPPGENPWPALPATAPPVDTDRDGMPDVWERSRGLDPLQPADGAALVPGTPYTNLERYLGELAGDPPIGG
jgi:pectate lyase